MVAFTHPEKTVRAASDIKFAKSDASEPWHLSAGLAALAVAVLTVIAAVGHADTRQETRPSAEKKGWVRLDTTNFTIFSKAGETKARSVGANLEQFRSVLQDLFNDMDLSSPVPTLIFVFNDETSFAPYNLTYQGRAKEQVGGYFGSGQLVNVVAIAGHRDGADLTATLIHEYLHSILNTKLPGLPLWLNEGLAELYSSFAVRDGVARIGDPIDSYLAWLRDHPLIPIAELVAVDRDSSTYNEGLLRGSFYAQSWALTHMLVIEQVDGPDRTAVYADLLRKGLDQDEAFLTAFETSYEALELELKQYVGRRRFGFASVPVVDSPEESATVSPVPDAEILYWLGNLLTTLGVEHHEAAAEHFRASLRADGTYGPAVAALGRLDELAGRTDEALAQYRRAAALSPDNFMVQFLLGNGLCQAIPGIEAGEARKTVIADARSALKRAIGLQPSYGEAWASLGRTAFWEEVPDETVVEAMERAHRLLPMRGDVGYNLAALHVKMGQLDEARAVVSRMTETGVEADTIRAANALILAAETTTPSRTAATDAVPVATGRTPGFTARYNEAIALVNIGNLEAAATALEALASGELTEVETTTARNLLDWVDSCIRFQARTDDGMRLARLGEIEAAIAVLEPLLDEAPERAQAARVERMLGRLYDFRDFQARYNRAVDHFNDGRYEEAAALLEPLAAQAPSDQLRAMARTLLAEIEAIRTGPRASDSDR